MSPPTKLPELVHPEIPVIFASNGKTCSIEIQESSSEHCMKHEIYARQKGARG